MRTYAPPPTIPIKLTPRDLRIVRHVGRFRMLSSFQIERIYFTVGKTPHHAAANRLAALTKAGILSRAFCYPTASRDPTGRPTAVYYWSERNAAVLKSYLLFTRQASVWDALRSAIAPAPNTERFSALFLPHELGISEFFLCLESSAAREGWTLPFWERTSPRSIELGTADERKLRVPFTSMHEGRRDIRIITSSFNPDGWFCTRDLQGRFSLYFLEFDNDSSQAWEFRQKLAGHLGYDRQGKFTALLGRYVRKYNLPITHVDQATFRTLTLTPTAQRRDQLLLDSHQLGAHESLLFGSLTDLTPDTALGPIWLRGVEWDAHLRAHEQHYLVSTRAAKRVHDAWMHDQLAKIPRVSLKD